MRSAYLVLSMLMVTACRHIGHDVGPAVPEVEVRVRREEPKELVFTIEQHGSRSFIDTKFLVLAPEEFKGLTFRLKILTEYQGALFDAQEFRLRLAKNLVLGEDRKRKNADGTTTVWSDSDGLWNFEGMTLETIKKANQVSQPTPNGVADR